MENASTYNTQSKSTEESFKNFTQTKKKPTTTINSLIGKQHNVDLEI